MSPNCLIAHEFQNALVFCPWFNDTSAQVSAKPDDHVLQHNLGT